MSALEPVISAARTFDDEAVLSFKLVADALTGASPNGATASDAAQTFTRPSGRGSYTVDAGDAPLDDTFRDTRVAVSAAYDWPLGRTWRAGVGANASSEYDFVSLSTSARIARDSADRNTTWSAGVSVEQDRLDPVGGVPIPFAVMAGAGAEQPRDGATEDKTVGEVLLGVTQVVSRDFLMSVNVGLSEVDGYQSDPYKLLSVVDPVSGETRRYLYERRPDSRSRRTFYWQGKRNLDGDVLDLSYRYMSDNWEVVSHTLEARYRWRLDGGYYLEPHLRWYTQAAASFYRQSLVDGEALPEYASADYRLGAFDATTLGARLGATTGRGHQWGLRLEVYEQRGDSSPGDAIGLQREQDLFPTVTAATVLFDYSFSW